MAMFNRHNLEIAKLASKNEGRFTLTAIRVTPKETIVTDGHLLVRVTAPQDSVQSFPEVPGTNLSDDFKPFNLPAESALKAAKELPKRANLPVLQNCAVSVTENGPYLVQTDLQNAKTYGSMDGSYPDVDRVMPKQSNMVFEINLDASLLMNLMAQFKGFMGKGNSSGQYPVTFRFQDDFSGLTMEAAGGEDQKMVAVLMPMAANKDSKTVKRFRRMLARDKAATSEQDTADLPVPVVELDAEVVSH